MIVVDTNVVSELYVRRPNPSVIAWFSRFAPLIGLPTVVIAELNAGAEMAKISDRREVLKREYAILVSRLRNQILLFDIPAALEYAALAAYCRRAGLVVQRFDGLIAATARARKAQVATRNVKDFQQLKVEIINPWEE